MGIGRKLFLFKKRFYPLTQVFYLHLADLKVTLHMDVIWALVLYLLYSAGDVTLVSQRDLLLSSCLAAVKVLHLVVIKALFSASSRGLIRNYKTMVV